MLGNLDINDCNQDLQELIRSTNGGVGFLKNSLTLTANSATAVLGFVYNTSTDALLVFQNGKYLEKDQYKVSSDGGYITPISGNWIASTSTPLVFNFILLKAIPLNMVSIDGALIADGTIAFSKVDSNFMTKMIKEFEDNYHMDATIIENGTIDITKLTQRIQDDIVAFENHILYTNAGHVPYGVASMSSQNVYTVSVMPKPTAYYDGMPVSIKIQNDATGVSTINVDSLGARGIKKANGADVKNFKKNGIYTLRYNSSTANFILQGEGGSGNAIPSDLRSGKTASTDDGDIIGTAPEQPATTYVVGTSDQIIASGKILSGDQIIKGYPDLIPQNVAEGKRIGNVVGELPVLDINKGGIMVGIPSLNIGEQIVDVIKIVDNSFYYVDKNYSIKYFDYKTRTISTASSVSVLNPYTGSFIDSGILKGVTKDYYVIGTLILDKSFNLIRNLADINTNLKNFKYEVIIDPYDTLDNRIYIKIYFEYSGSGSQYDSESIISYNIGSNTSNTIASVGTGSGWASASTVFKNRVIIGNDVSDRDTDVYKIVYTARDINTGDTITLRTDQWVSNHHTQQNQLFARYYTCTNSKRLIELTWSRENTTGTNVHDNVVYMIYTVYNDYGAGYYSFKSSIYNDYGDVIEIGKLAKIVYNIDIESYVDKDMFTLRTATMKTSLTETYLAFSKNFIICASGNLYLYN